MFSKADDFIDIYIQSENEQELNTGFKFFVQKKAGDYVELNKGTKKFSKTDAAWGFRALSKKSINDFLFEGHLVIR